MSAERRFIYERGLFEKYPIGYGDGVVDIRKVGKGKAEFFIRNGHYSKTTVWNSTVHLGVFFDGWLVGAIQYGHPMNPSSSDKVVPGGKCLELNRLWLPDERKEGKAIRGDKPKNAGSRAVSYSIRLVRKLIPDVTWIQSYADSRCGKMGALYQACSFLYCGSHETTFYELDGEWFHQSMMGRPAVDKRGWWCGPKIARLNAKPEDATAHVFTQYRYIRPLTKKARHSLALPVLPYPKP